MSIANTEQAEHWNIGDGVAHWIAHQAGYDRMHASFTAPDRIRQILATAGWRDIEITSAHASILIGGGGSVDDAVEFLRTGSIGQTILAGADAATADRAIASVRAALTPYADAKGLHLDAAVWLVQAVAP